MRTAPFIAAALLTAWLVSPAVLNAGTSRPAYCDGGQSMDGRFVVIPALVKSGERVAGGNWHWKYTWKDTRTGKVIEGKLQGLNHGLDRVYGGVHAHLFVAPDGETFAVWNCRAWAPYTAAERRALQGADKTGAAFQNFSGFSHRLVIYKKTGEIVKRFDMKDILKAEEWVGVNPGPGHAFWLAPFSPLSAKTAPRSDYALYRVSPDYTVIEFVVTDFAKRTNRAAFPDRRVLISLTDGRLLDPDKKPEDANKVPGRPFKGGPGRGDQRDYVPSLDPVRVEGKYQGDR